MTQATPLIMNIVYIVGIILGAAVSVGIVMYSIGQFKKGRSDQTNTYADKLTKDQADLIATYEKRFTLLEEQMKEQKNNYEKELGVFRQTNLENTKAIADLQGQIKVYKELPLQELASGIQALTVSNNEIRDILTKSAVIAANDKHDMHVNNQHVDNQIVNPVN